MLGYAVSGFVDGFFKGRDWRDGKEDRKLNRERQKRLDAMDAEKHTMGLQEFDLRKRALDTAFAEQERLDQRRTEEEEYYRRLQETMPQGGASGGLGIDPSMYPIGRPAGEIAPVAVPPPQAAASPKLGFGALPAPPNGGAGVAAMPGGPGADTLQTPPFLIESPDGKLMATRPPRDASERRALAEVAKAGRLTMAPERVDRQKGIDSIAANRMAATQQVAPPAVPAPQAPPQSGMGLPVPPVTAVNPNSTGFVQDVQGLVRRGDISGGVMRLGNAIATGGDGGLAAGPGARAISGIVDYFTKTPDAASQAAASRAQRAEALRWYKSPEANAVFSANPDLLTEAAKDPAGFYAKIASQAPAAGATPAGQASAAPNAAQAAAAQRGPQVSTAATKDVVGKVALSFGLKPADKMTPKQVKTAADATVQWFYETVVPEMVQFYVGRGEIDKAKAYIELIESNQGKVALEERAAAAFRAVNGDIDGWGQGILSAFKRYGYIDPTFDIDEEATSIKRDDSGNFVGAQLVFRDRKTGNTVAKDFQSEEELIDYGMVMTDPATMVEYLTKPQAEAKGGITDQDILETAAKLYEGSLGQLTPEQAIAQAAAMAKQAAFGGLGAVGASQRGFSFDPRITGVGQNGLYREQ